MSCYTCGEGEGIHDIPWLPLEGERMCEFCKMALDDVQS